MSNIRLLTLDDLYTYYENQGKNIKFSSENDDANLIVQIHGKAEFTKKKDNDQEGLLAVHLQANHTKQNKNGSNIEDEVCEKALSSFKNRPILGYLHQVDGEWQFWGHNMHEDDNGNIEYDEVPIGIIPESCNATLKYDKEKDKKYVEVDGLIFEEYSHAAEVLEREGQCDVSVELSIRELSYNAQEKYLDIENYFYSGVTVLGCDDNGKKICPGMEGSNITIADFSLENNSNLNDINEKLDNFFEKISSLFNNIDSTKGGNGQMTKFEELLEKYNKTVEEIEFEYEGLSDEELEAKFAEIFAESEEESQTENESENESESEGESEESEESFEAEDESEGEPEDEAEETDEADEESEESEPVEEYSVKCSVAYGENIQEFAVSLSDIQYALSELVNTTYADENSYYGVEVFMDEQYVIMTDFWTGQSYKQNFKCKKKKYSLHGDRVAVKAVYLTEDEEAELDKMRSNYSSIETQLNEYQAKEEIANKKTLMSSDEYASIAENEKFMELKKSVDEETDKLTYAELKEEADKIQLEAAKSGNLKFAAATNVVNEVGRVTLPLENKKTGRYGTLFSNNN